MEESSVFECSVLSLNALVTHLAHFVPKTP